MEKFSRRRNFNGSSLFLSTEFQENREWDGTAAIPPADGVAWVLEGCCAVSAHFYLHVVKHDIRRISHLSSGADRGGEDPMFEACEFHQKEVVEGFTAAWLGATS